MAQIKCYDLNIENKKSKIYYESEFGHIRKEELLYNTSGYGTTISLPENFIFFLATKIFEITFKASPLINLTSPIGQSAISGIDLNND